MIEIIRGACLAGHARAAMKRLLAAATILIALTATAADPPKFSGSVRVRSESWNFFDAGSFDDEYTFLGILLRASMAQQLSPSLDYQVELAVPALVNLPDTAIAPAPRGQLGFGGSYFAANGDENTAAIFPKQAFIRWKSGAHMVRAGRFEFIDGTEVTPKNAMLAPLKSSRVAHRLIGNFGFSHVGRSADGVQYAFNRDAINVTAATFRPTQGAFNVSGLEELDDVGVAYGAFTYSRPNADERIFLLAYHDGRDDVLKTDNRPAALRSQDRADIDVMTVGGHYLAAFGKADVLVWAALQGGDWGLLEHHAGALALETGYHFSGPKSAVISGGVFRSSGDDDPNDDEHGTFFQVLPTPRIYARFPFYNAMNSTDTFVQFSFKPAPKFGVTSELHALRMSEERDLWYSGGGAFEDNSFGFAGRSSGRDDLARVIDVSVDYAWNPKTSFTAYLGLVKGGEAVDAIFDDDGAGFFYFEVTRRF